jgi:dienelactone hydrolase
MPGIRRLLLACAACAAVSGGALAGSAQADVTSVFPRIAPGDTATDNPHPIPCAVQSSDHVRFCQGSAGTSALGAPDTRVLSFDSTPIDVNVTLPAAASGDGNYPLVIMLHGYGGSKKDLDTPEEPWLPSAHEWANMGYAVLNMSDRGFGDSCGSSASRASAVVTAAEALNPAGGQACQSGWVKLLDMRYEVHDAQYLAGLLVDQGLVDPNRIGATGESYGGGASMDLASLKDRIVEPDGSVIPWVSPIKKTPIKLAAAAPTIPWTDLISSLTSNGRGLDVALAGPNTSQVPPGIEKSSFVSGLYAEGLAASGYYAPPMADPTADLTTWFSTIDAGEPYDPSPPNPGVQPIFDQFRWFKGSYYVLDGTADMGKLASEAPAPLLMSNGFTDDLFPVDETVRYYNLMRAVYPKVPVSLMYLDYGHMRGTNKTADVAKLKVNVVNWFNRYVQGGGPDPGQYVEALTQTCPSKDAAGNFTPSGGPFMADSWVSLHPGALVYTSSAAQTVSSTGGNPSVAVTFDPVSGGGAACASAPGADEPNSANYTLPVVTANGYTMLGSPTIVAKLAVTGTFAEVAMRLLDVAPDGTETLVARGAYRPVGDGKPEVFQLHPGAWRFAAGHRPKLQLLGRDVPYLRASNGNFQILVSDLSLVLPTHETRGNGIIGGGVSIPIPAGFKPAPGASTTPLKGFTSFKRASCPSSAHSKKPAKHSGKDRARSAAKQKKSRRGAKHHKQAKHRASCAPAKKAPAKHKPAKHKPAKH